MAKHYGVRIAVCPANRPQRKGVVEKAIGYLTQSWWRSAPVSTPAQAQADLDRWCLAVSDRRRRGQRTVGELAAAESLLSLPELPFGAEYREQRVVSRDALVEFETNRYSVPPGHAGQAVEVRARLGEVHLEIYTPAGHRIARHRHALAGVGQTIRTEEHTRALEHAVLEQFTTSQRCPRKPNRPPGERAQAEAAGCAARAQAAWSSIWSSGRGRERGRAMIEHRRYEAHATLRSGECERRIDGSGLQLVRVILTDGGIVVAPDGTEHRRPDVICHLRPRKRASSPSGCSRSPTKPTSNGTAR